MIRFDEIMVGDRVRGTKGREEIVFVITERNPDFIRGESFRVYHDSGFSFELLDRPKSLCLKLADRYGELEGYNRYQRFAILVKEFGLDDERPV